MSPNSRIGQQPGPVAGRPDRVEVIVYALAESAREPADRPVVPAGAMLDRCRLIDAVEDQHQRGRGFEAFGDEADRINPQYKKEKIKCQKLN